MREIISPLSGIRSPFRRRLIPAGPSAPLWDSNVADPGAFWVYDPGTDTWTTSIDTGIRTAGYVHPDGLTDFAEVRVTGTLSGWEATGSTFIIRLGSSNAQGNITVDGPFEFVATVHQFTESIQFGGSFTLPGVKTVTGLTMEYVLPGAFSSGFSSGFEV